MSAKERIIPIFVPHLGCPRDCVFCNQRSIAAPHEPSFEETVAEIDAALKRSGDGAELAYYGGSFTAIEPKKRREYLAAAKIFLDAGRLSSVRVSTRPDCIDKAILDELREFGVKTIELGAQSTDDHVLELSNRGHTKRDIELASELIRAEGFTLGLQMMIGLPGETPIGHIDTARELIRMRADFVRVYPTVVIKHTRLEQLWRSGEYEALTPERAAALSADVLELFEEASIPVVRLGLNPTETMDGEAVAGAYHPALGDMAYGELMRRRAAKLLRELNGVTGVALLVAPGRASTLIGQHRRNIEALKSEFSLKNIRICEDKSLKRFDVALEKR